jgi:YVTN family beta-propeller protein
VVAFAVTQGGNLFRPDRVQPTAPAAPAGTYIGVARGPVGVSVNAGIVWVASKSGTLTTVDPQTNRSIVQIPVGGEPSDIAVANDLAWYSDSADGTVKRVSTDTHQFVGAPVSIASQGHIDVDIGPQGTVWAAGTDAGTLYAIDAGTGDVVNNQYMTRPVELGIGPGALWALAEDGRTLVRTDFSTGEESLRVSLDGDVKTDLAVTSEDVFVAAADGTVTQINATDGAQLGTFKAAGTNPELAIGKGALWIASDTGNGHAELARLDPTDLRPVRGPVKFLGTPTDVALGEGAVWVTDSRMNAVVRLNVAH